MIFDGTDRDQPRWFAIEPHRPFLQDLAWGLNRALETRGPEALADAVVLTPTRRAGRALHEAFLTTLGGRSAALLPQIRTLGDLDEGEPPFEPAGLALDLPPAIGPMRRRFELARLALEHQALIDRRLDAAGALEMGAALGRLFESAAIEERSERLLELDALVEGDFAEHWRLSSRFLQACALGWTGRLRELDLIDAPERQVRLMRALAEQWRTRPPQGVIVAAGSMGGAPAAADLLAAVAEAPLGAVVLPGLDRTLPDAVWAQIGEAEEQHPQSPLKRLLDAVRVERADVRLWPSPETPANARRGRRRQRVIEEALRPVEATADWLGAIRELRRETAGGEDPIREGLEGLTVLPARHEDEAALLAALLLRETLETPGTDAAVVTPDPVSARRIQAALSRFGVVADSSAGEPLSLSPVAELARLTLQAAASGPPDGVAILALLKNPLTRLGREPGELARTRGTLETRALRGPAVRRWDRLERKIAEAAERTNKEKPGWEERLAGLESAARLLADVRAVADAVAAPFAHGDGDAVAAARALVAGMERLAANETGSTGGLWAGPEGEAAARLFDSLLEDGAALPPVTPSGFTQLVDGLFAAEVVRSGEATHGRVRILGAVEARLIRADRLILLGLEEGVWPAPAPTDPFLSRPMRAKLGLPPPERRVGQAAHDFVQAACAPEVWLIHAERRGGAPAVKSRWLWRLETLASGAGVTLPSRPELLAWARALDRPTDPPRPAPRPEPRPPASVRPNTLSATRVEGWIRDPYAIYAQYVLNLTPMSRPSEAVEAAARGTAIHSALEAFAGAFPDTLPADCEQQILRFVEAALEDVGMDDPTLVRERLLAAGCARWLTQFEAERRANGARVLVERRGEHPVMVDGEPFTVTARADRLEEVDGVVHVWDYKTGHAPTRKEIDSGLSPQLTLTAAIIAGGGFPGLPSTPGDLGYVRLTGREPPGESLVRVEAAEAPAAAEQVLDDLTRRVRAFRRESTPYRSWQQPRLLSKFGGDYDRLARVWEWFVIGADDEEAGG